MKAKLILFALVFVLTSCNKNEMYDEFNRDFSDNRWAASDVKSFEFENTQSEGVCELKLHFGHISGFQFKDIPLEVTITSPDGKVEKLSVIMKLIDESGKVNSICNAVQV